MSSGHLALGVLSSSGNQAACLVPTREFRCQTQAPKAVILHVLNVTPCVEPPTPMSMYYSPGFRLSPCSGESPAQLVAGPFRNSWGLSLHVCRSQSGCSFFGQWEMSREQAATAFLPYLEPITCPSLEARHHAPSRPILPQHALLLLQQPGINTVLCPRCVN